MENLHLKNLKDNFKKTLPINLKYLNKVFSTPYLSYEEFNKTFVLHNNFNDIIIRNNFMNDLYQIYKLNVSNYKPLLDKLIIYNLKYTTDFNWKPFNHIDFSRLIIQTYTEDQIIKELYNENEQKLFYNYINKLNEIRNKKFPHIKSINLINNQITVQHHLSTILNHLKDDLTNEERIKALPQEFPILSLSGVTKQKILRNIIAKQPNFQLQDQQAIEKEIQKLVYHMLNLFEDIDLTKIQT